MLILTRRANGESVYIGDNIVISVLGIRGNQVRLGITAPSEVPVHREEIYERIQKHREEIYERIQEQRARGHDATPLPRK